ncbi:mitochondrial glycoprotein [Cantharellus anzutake]|uniref:mitochondrial glycoprotein n=1 Tax=Cantharellus anzutake TaxID=1750568 RepID=UPI001904E6D2|nr:mitochondrial glycoprotein [Cantharellus anzutake]KAF8343106.1 mitochondrial glycoprotein [Cantharellus anzutake]
MAGALRSLRPLARTLCTVTRPTSSLAFRSTAPRAISTPLARSFMTTKPAFGSGESDLALSQKLAEELQYEKETAPSELVPAFLETFKKDRIWTIEDKDGLDEVSLTRQFGNETIRVLFSIADIDSTPDDPEFVDGAEGEESESGHTFPVRVSITITKPNSGALSVDAVAGDGAFVVDNIAFYQDAKLATELTAEADWKRRGLYIGPQFGHLDVAVQELFEQYLEERGINSSFAVFIPEYAEMKEQKEYVKWLSTVKQFIDV